MYAGRIVECGTVEQVLSNPMHPYTRGLLDSMPGQAAPGSRLVQIDGIAPPFMGRETAFAFRPRCPKAAAICAQPSPKLLQHGGRPYSRSFPIQVLVDCFAT